ncbi:hypothetical protein, partial [Burkholderia sp.]|uniref:hypothetical protein n=1 Tax=Burkholderia sp. TaxID=36773 RepID=UPI00258C18F9
ADVSPAAPVTPDHPDIFVSFLDWPEPALRRRLGPRLPCDRPGVALQRFVPRTPVDHIVIRCRKNTQAK